MEKFRHDYFLRIPKFPSIRVHSKPRKSGLRSYDNNIFKDNLTGFNNSSTFEYVREWENEREFEKFIFKF